MTRARSSVVRAVAAALESCGGLSKSAHLLLAVSGGADSVALLLAMNALKRSSGFRMTVAHLDHRLRGAEGRADAAFVGALASRLGLMCVTGRSDVRALARRKRISIEMAAREARYRFLARTARAQGATAVVTAHTADDQAETLLLRLVRGSGATGLGGIRPVGRLAELGFNIPASDIALLRPMLTVSRDEIEAYLTQSDQPWRDDTSNVSMAFLRNRVRHEVLPVMRDRLNPSITSTLGRTAAILAEEERWLDAMASEALGGCRGARGCLERDAINNLPVALVRRVMRKWLVAEGVHPDMIDFNAVERVRHLAQRADGSRKAVLQGPWCVVRRYGRLTVESVRPAHTPFRIALNVQGETLLPEFGLRTVVTCAPGMVRDAGNRPGQLPAAATLSRRVVGRCRLYLRSPQPGDRMHPFGMQGSRKLQDIFVDAKVPADKRGAIPVLECRGQIAWLPGYRIADPFRVTEGEPSPLQIRIECL